MATKKRKVKALAGHSHVTDQSLYNLYAQMTLSFANVKCGRLLIKTRKEQSKNSIEILTSYVLKFKRKIF